LRLWQTARHTVTFFCETLNVLRPSGLIGGTDSVVYFL
jgi:hypothetical protein